MSSVYGGEDEVEITGESMINVIQVSSDDDDGSMVASGDSGSNSDDDDDATATMDDIDNNSDDDNVFSANLCVNDLQWPDDHSSLSSEAISNVACGGSASSSSEVNFRLHSTQPPQLFCEKYSSRSIELDPDGVADDDGDDDDGDDDGDDEISFQQYASCGIDSLEHDNTENQSSMVYSDENLKLKLIKNIDGTYHTQKEDESSAPEMFYHNIKESNFHIQKHQKRCESSSTSAGGYNLYTRDNSSIIKKQTNDNGAGSSQFPSNAPINRGSSDEGGLSMESIKYNKGFRESSTNTANAGKWIYSKPGECKLVGVLKKCIVTPECSTAANSGGLLQSEKGRAANMNTEQQRAEDDVSHSQFKNKLANHLNKHLNESILSKISANRLTEERKQLFSNYFKKRMESLQLGSQNKNPISVTMADLMAQIGHGDRDRVKQSQSAVPKLSIPAIHPKYSMSSLKSETSSVSGSLGKYAEPLVNVSNDSGTVLYNREVKQQTYLQNTSSHSSSNRISNKQPTQQQITLSVNTKNQYQPKISKQCVNTCPSESYVSVAKDTTGVQSVCSRIYSFPNNVKSNGQHFIDKSTIPSATVSSASQSGQNRMLAEMQLLLKRLPPAERQYIDLKASKMGGKPIGQQILSSHLQGQMDGMFTPQNVNTNNETNISSTDSTRGIPESCVSETGLDRTTSQETSAHLYPPPKSSLQGSSTRSYHDNSSLNEVQHIMAMFPEADRHWVQSNLKIRDMNDVIDLILRGRYRKSKDMVDGSLSLPAIKNLSGEKRPSTNTHLDREMERTWVSPPKIRKISHDDRTIKKDAEQKKAENMETDEGASTSGNDSSSNQIDLVCEFCDRGSKFTDFVQCARGHLLCNKCIEKEAKCILKGDKQGCIMCPRDSCPGKVVFSECKRVLPEFILEMLQEKLDRGNINAIANMQGAVQCRYCGYKLILPTNEKQFVCGNTACKKNYCRCCLKSLTDFDHRNCDTPCLEMPECDSSTNVPKHWSTMDPDKDFVLEEVNVESLEYQQISNLFFDKPQQNIFTSIRIYRVQNPNLWQKYFLTRKQMINALGNENLNEKRLFHGTASQFVDVICRDGFDWRVCGKNGTSFGEGCYFATAAQYSHFYTEKNPSSFIRSTNKLPNSRSTANVYTQLGLIVSAASYPQCKHVDAYNKTHNAGYNKTHNAGYNKTHNAGNQHLTQQARNFLNAHEGQTKQNREVVPRRMFVARVLAGKSTLGQPVYRRPPQNPLDPKGRAFNSCVNNEMNPSVFVIFDNCQCYPEFIIEYSINAKQRGSNL